MSKHQKKVNSFLINRVIMYNIPKGKITHILNEKKVRTTTSTKGKMGHIPPQVKKKYFQHTNVSKRPKNREKLAHSPQS